LGIYDGGTFVFQLGASPTANYIHWRLVQEFATETNKLMNNLAFEFSRVSYGTAEPQPRFAQHNLLNNESF